MAKALKLMTWNLQHLPWLARRLGNAPIAGWAGMTEPEPKARARAVARAILDMPPREQPDVVAFNEAFGEEGRRWLLRLLNAKFPFIIERLEAPGQGIEEDSGLMLFSKLQLLVFTPSGDTVRYERFPVAAGNDAKAAKGVGIVLVDRPFDRTTIAFAHLQASYDAANTENMNIRADQLKFVRDELLEAAGTAFNPLENYANGVIVGDLNVKGDPDDISGEWSGVFAATPDTFGGDWSDGWRAYMHPPNDLTDFDPGYTQRDAPTGIRNRFDYVCARRDPDIRIGLVAHHMFSPFQLASGITGHWPLMAHLHRLSDNCTPSTAVELLKTAPLNAGQPASQIWALEINFLDEDMYHWVYIGEPGTYSVWTSAPLEVHAFRRTDYSHALDPIDTLSMAQLPSALQSTLSDLQLVDKGSVFAWREPFFLRFRGTATSFKGKAGFTILRHRGESAATAIVLLPHLPTDPQLPAGQPLGLNDECFFRVDRPNQYSAEPYRDEFLIDSPHGVFSFDVLLRDAAQVPIGFVFFNANFSRFTSAETIYLVLMRHNINDVEFIVEWESGLTYLALDESLRLHVEDETGPDWLGADELELRVSIDTDSIYHGTWADADAGEDWPDLVKDMQSSALAHTGNAKWVAFTDAVSFDVIKIDGISAHGSSIAFIKPLSPFDLDIETRTATLTITDPAGDGKLTAHVTLSRFPPT